MADLGAEDRLVSNLPWTVESEEVSPTLKLRCRHIQAKYAAEIEGMYA